MTGRVRRCGEACDDGWFARSTFGVRNSRVNTKASRDRDCGVTHLALAAVRGRELVKALPVLVAASQHAADSAQQLVEVAREVDELGGIVGTWHAGGACVL